VRLALAALVTALAACGPWGPQGIFPGGPLAGDTVLEPVRDWSFTEDHPLIAVETRGRFFRHSVTVICMAEEGQLYLAARHAPRKRWVANLMRDPRIRLGIGGRVYAARAVRIEGGAEGRIARAFLRKYVGVEAEHAEWLDGPPAPGDDRAEVWTFRVDPPEPGA
jgi:hypothetical protein